jgi:16S rRNA (guanine966-N2)-methyltransferase
VAGTARGVRLDAPPGRAVRPTSDRVKEAAFNALTSMEAIADATVLDLFAGSGGLGIEALSRGAARATFVDDAAASLTAVRANLARTGFDERARVVRSDALRYLAGASGTPPDLALLDPPYEFDRWDELLDLVASPVLLIESDRLVAVPDRYGVLRERRYGTTVVLIAELQERRS